MTLLTYGVLLAALAWEQRPETKWLPSFEAGREVARMSGRPLLVVFR